MELPLSWLVEIFNRKSKNGEEGEKSNKKGQSRKELELPECLYLKSSKKLLNRDSINKLEKLKKFLVNEQGGS